MSVARVQTKTNMNEEMVSIEEITVQAQPIAIEGQAQEANTMENTAEVAVKDKVNVTEIVMNAVPFSAKNAIKSVANSGGFSIVKAKTGNRITISKQGYEHLGKPSTMKFAFNDTSLIIGEKLPNNDNDFNVKDSNGKAMVYSTPLVKEIVEAFELNFDNRTSMTFGDIQYTNNEDSQVIIVKIK